MRGVVAAITVYENGNYVVRIHCKDRQSYELVKRKLRLIGVFISKEKGFP